MKTSLKTAIGLFLLSIFAVSSVFALCTMTPDNTQCFEDESCTISTGCTCYGHRIANTEICLGFYITGENNTTSIKAISGTLLSFKFTITSYTGDKYFVLHLPWTSDYGIQYLDASVVPENNSTLSLSMGGVDPYFIIHSGETKTIIITGKVITNQYRSFATMRATGMVYLDPLFQLPSTFTGILSPRIDPIAELVVTKIITGTLPIFSGEIAYYKVYLKNIGSATSFGYTFFDKMPSVLRSPIARFNGTFYNWNSYNASTNTYTWSGTYLDIDPGQTIVIDIQALLSSTPSPGTLLQNEAGVRNTYPDNEYDTTNNTGIATGSIPSYLDLFASSIVTGSQNPQLSGDEVAFTIRYAQTGNITATGITMTISISGTDISGFVANIPNLAPGATGAYTITGRVNANYPLDTLICAQAYLSSPTETQATGNNKISACYKIAPIADIHITKILGSGSISPQGVFFSDWDTLQTGSRLIYIITVANSGTQTISGITVTDILPPQTSPFYVGAGGQIVGNTVQWIIPSLAPGQTQNFGLTVKLESYPSTGFILTNTGIVTFTGRDSNPANNIFVLSRQLPGLPDLYINKTLLPFSGFTANTPITYVLEYGNKGTRSVSGVYIIDLFPSVLNLIGGQTGWIIGTLSPGQTGKIILTGTMRHFMTGGTSFVNIARIGASSTGLTFISNLTYGSFGTPANIQISTANFPYDISELDMTNNISIVTGTIPTIENIYVDLIANNLTRPQLDNPPYGTNQNTMIQAVSGDLVRFTVFYGNNGNIPVNNVLVSLGSLAGIASIQNTNVSLGTLYPGTTGMLIITGVVGPKNFVRFSPVLTLRYAYNAREYFKTDTLTITEPLACGDGLVTQTEECDTNGQIGNLSAGQECENQQGSCVVVTKFIINSACVGFDYTNPVSGYGTGASCASVALPLAQASCSSLLLGTATSTATGTSVGLTCHALNARPTTKIAINCGNGMILSGFGTSLVGNCLYTPGFNGNASCLVGGETVPSSGCIKPIGIAGPTCRVRSLDGDMVILDRNGDGSTVVECSTSDGNPANITINCGNGSIYNGYGASFAHVCTYTNENMPKKRTLSCTINNGATTCNREILLDEGFLGECGNGIREGYEQCDDGNNRNGDGCSARCEREDEYSPPACFSVNNGNISVQEGEKMPFRWNLEIKPRKIETKSDTYECDPGDIKRDSMKCTFKLYNGDSQQKNNDPDKIFTENCYNPNGRERYSTLFSYFTDSNIFSSQAKAFGRFAFPITSAVTKKIYGEYKLVLDQVEYEYCGEDQRRHTGKPVGRICEVNFTITRPYLVQRSVFGLTPKSTDIDLRGYKTINGNDLISETQLDKIMTVDANEYKGGSKIYNMIDAFIKKYQKLALTVNVNKPAGVKTVKKVPNQNILIFEGNGEDVVVDGEYTKTPFTIIADKVNLVISGDLTTNAMFLVNNGNIKFDNGNLCNKKNQEVQGIFVVRNGKFMNSPSSLANNSNARPRCNYGGLYVKGVLIGDGIDTLVKARRSQLNSWFYLVGDNANSHIAQRRNKIFNGAAVLIEYSPSLRSALPPGANEFTKALEVYKK